MGKRHGRKDRVLAFILTLMIVFTTIMPAPQIDVVKAEEAVTEPETTVSTTFSVVDTSGDLVSYDELNIFDSEGTPIEADENDSYSLTVDTKYSYEIKKSGYKDFEDTFEATESTTELKWYGELDEIKVSISEPFIVSDSAVSINVSDSFTLEVTNKIEEASYTCQAENVVQNLNDEVLSVIGNDDGTWSITANREGKATITIASGEEGHIYEITVTVSKKDSNVDFNITPDCGANNIQSIEFEVTGLENDATGEVQFWVNNEIEQTLTLGESNTWTYRPDGGLVGNYTFKVTYTGDDKYKSAESEVKTVNGFSKSQNVDFKDADGSEPNAIDNPHRVELSTDTENPQTVELTLSDTYFVADTSEIKYESSDPEVLEVTPVQNDNTKIIVTVKGSGKADITVSVPELGDGKYLEATDTYYFYVEKTYTIEDIASQLVFDTYEKTYDGKKDVELTATLSADKLSTLHIFNQDNIDLTKELKFTFTGIVNSANADTYDAVTVTKIKSIIGFDKDGGVVELINDSNIARHIVLVSNTVVSASVTILRRTVYLGTKDFNISYGQNVQDALKNLTGYVVEVPDTENLDITGILEADKENVLSEFKVTTNQSIYDIGPNADVIIVDFAGSKTAVDKYLNYNFVQGADSALGDLTVTQQNVTINDIFDAIGSFVVEDGVLHAVKEENTNINSKIWISDGKLKASVTGDNYKDYYDKVMFQVGENTYDLTEGYDVSNLITSEISGEIYLMKDDNTSRSVEFSFYVDKTVPTFTFGDWPEKESLKDGWQGTIKFGNFENETYTIENVSWNDDNTDNNVESSGVKEWSYYVHKVTSDADLKADALQTYVENNAITWLDGNEATSITLDGNEGNYIVLVKIKDNVNNSVVYTSNGIVFDVKEPNITIVGLGENGSTYTIDPDKYYNDDVKFKVEFNDEEVTSGLATIEISILKDGNVVETPEILSLIEEKITYTLDELEELATKTYEGIVSKDLNSNDLAIKAVATDHAGNQYSEEVHLRIDSKKPTMSISFDNNNVKNNKYFNENRVMTIKVKERNIDTITKGMTFDVKAGVGIDTKEVTEGVTLEGLAAYGISYVWKEETDTQKNTPVKERTDERTVDLVLTFDKDNEYYIVPHCTDLAGNTEGSIEYASDSVCKTEFVIDKTAPVINVTYNKNGITANEANRFYTQDNVEATIQITEQNFWLVNGESKQFSKADAQLEQMDFSKTNASEAVPEKNMTEYYDAEAEKIANWSANEIDYTTTMTFAPDANYTFGFTYTDLAGNSATYEPHYFTVDEKSPNGEIVISKDVISEVVKEILQIVTFNIFKNTTYLVEITSTDATAGVAETYYYKAANILTAAQVEDLERGTANGWQLLDAGNKKFNVSPNEQFVVYGLIIDKCGNETILYPTRGAVADDTRPDVAKLEIISTPRNGIYKDDVKFEVTVTDPIAGNTYSGIKTVWYTVIAAGNVNKTQEFAPIVDNSADIKQSHQTVTEQFTVTANDFNSNKVTVQVHVEDFSGNCYDSNPVVFAMDATDTAMKVSFNNDADVKNGKYFNTDRIMTITVTDRNIDMSETDGMTFDVKAGANIAGQEVAKNVTLKDLRDTYGVNYEWKNDSQANVEKGLRTDTRTADLVLTFNKDNEYYIVPHCMDLGGRSEVAAPDYGKSICTKEFVIDKTAPVIKVTYNQEGIKADAAKRFYTQDAVKATIQITEQNFWIVNGENKKFSKGTAQPEQMNFSETSATEAVPEKNMTEYYDAEAENTANWSANGVEYTTTMTFAPDANYTFGFTYTDLAGNPATYEKHYFTVDDTAPETGSIVVESDEAFNIGKLLWKVITFDIFYDDSYTVKFTSNDNTAGMKATYYHKSHDALTEEEVKALADDEWILLNPKDMSFKVSPNEQFVVYEKMVDKALNVSYVYPKQGAIADNAAPTIKVTNETESRNGIHNSDVTLKVVVKDPTVGDTYSGIERVWYTITADGNVVAEETKDLVVNTDKVQGNQDWTGKIVVDAKKFNSNNVKVQVFAKDFTGNEYVTDIIPLKIDVTEPTITITYNLNEPLNEKYYNATRTATITVTERNFDETAARFEITNTDGTPAVIGEWTKGTDTGVLDSTTNTCKVTFAADGDYTVAFDCTDLAGNDSQVVKTEDFTIDQTVPEINVSFDNNEASNGTYYAASRTATITVNEHNFNGSELQASIIASLKAEGISVPGVNGWSSVGDVHSATIHFGEDGDYSFTLNYSDLAGNAAQEFVVTEFTIDQTKPFVEILDIEDHSANNGEVAPRIEYSDVNYDVESVSISIEGVKHELTYVDGTRNSIEDGQSIKLDDFAHEASVDDVYTLTASITDRAGNVETQSVLFSVNRFGSTYLFSEDTEALLDKYYINQEQDIVVTEINVDTLEKHEVSYGRDGELFHLTEGEDYTVTASGSEVSWQSYEYVIAAKNFMQEGLYNITIDSTDRATNEVNNKVKVSDIEFVVDKTKPSVVITGIEDNGSYKEDSRDITIVVADNVAMGNVDIHLNQNSKPDKSYDAEEILAQKGELQYQMNSSKQNQTIGVIATDAAGNAADLVEYTVLISSNALILFVNNTPLLVGTVGAVAAAGGIGIFAFRRRKIIK